MDRTELQTIQRPLKERYRAEPASAVVTLTATGELDEQEISCSVATGRAPVGFRAIRLIFDLDSDASEEQLEQLLSLTERYCVVYQTLAGGVPVSIDQSS